MVLERAHKLVHLFSPFVRVVLLCAVDSSPTSPNSGAKIVGGFLRSENPIFLFFSLFSASFSCCFILFRWRARGIRLNSYFQGAGLKKKVVCKVLEQIIKGFRAAITKKTHFLAKNGQKKPFFRLKRCFSGPSGHR